MTAAAVMTASPRVADKAFNRLAELKPTQPPPEPEDRRERYFVFMGDFPGCPAVDLGNDKVNVGGTTVDTRCIPDRVLWRGLVTPCVTTPVMAPYYAIPVGRKLHGTEVYDRDRNLTAAKMLEFSGPAADDLIIALGNQNGNTEQQRGLVEIAPDLLRGRPFEEVREYNLTFMFFPNWPYDVPATHSETREKIEAAIAMLESGTHPEFAFSDDPAKRIDSKGRDTHWLKKLYLQAGEDMLRAVDQAEHWHNSVAERANVNIARSDTDSKHKDGFDGLDETAFLRTGVIKTTKQMQEMVKASRDNRGSNDKVAEAVAMMAETQKQFAASMTAPQPNNEVAELKAELAEMRKLMQQNAAPASAAAKLPKKEG
jgi:hypothetical protein